MATAAPAKRLKEGLPSVRTYVVRVTTAFKTDCNYLAAHSKQIRTYESAENFKQMYLWAHSAYAKMQTFSIFITTIKTAIQKNPSVMDQPIDPAAADGTNTEPKIPPENYQTVNDRYNVLQSYVKKMHVLFMEISNHRTRLEAAGLM